MTQRIGHYEIIQKLGEGGMGVVYKARDMRLDRLVALKMLPDNRFDPTQRERLIREARTASALNHPNIVTIYDIDSADDMQLIAMEYVSGRSLAEMVRSGGLPVADVLQYAAQIAEAAAKAHAAGIIHRDLKPANIMVSEDGLIKILDFGLAKRYAISEPTDGNSTIEAELTKPGFVLGTVAYMSPEQAFGEVVDARSDVFSLGVVLYELLSGVRPFVGITTLATLQKIHVETPQPLSLSRPEVPGSIERIIGKALQKNRNNRYQTMLEMRADLLAVSRQVSGSGALPSISLPVISKEVAHLFSRYRAVVWKRRWAVGIICLLLIGAVEFQSIRQWASEIRISKQPADLVEPSNVPASAMTASDWTMQAQSWLQRYDKIENVDRAIAACKKALERDPANAMANAVAAQAYYRKMGLMPDPQWERLANESARRALELNAELAAAHLANGIVQLSARHWDEAASEFQRAKELDPLSADAHMWEGEYYFQKNDLNDLNKAENSYDRAVQLNPASWTPYSYLGTFLYKNARYADAVKAYRLALERSVDNVIVLRNLAGAYHMLNQYEDAAATLQRALEIQPTAGVYTNLGTARFFQGRYADAVTAFDKAVDINPTRYLYWGNLADAHRWIPGHERQANESYRQAIMLAQEKLLQTPNDSDLLGSIAVYYAKIGDRQNALDAVGRLEKMANRTAGSYFKTVLVYELSGDRANALQALEAAIDHKYPLSEIKNEPELTALRADRRYHDILAR